MKQKALSSRNRTELRLYRRLGVPLFRVFLLRCEKIRHFRDKGYNVNYHLAGTSAAAVEKFTGYLLYHTLLHTVSIVLTTLFLLLLCRSDYHAPVLYVISGILYVLNLYCLLLQRYHQLQIRDYLYRYYRHAEHFARACAESYSAEQKHSLSRYVREEDKTLAEKLMACLISGQDCLLPDSTVSSLERMVDIMKSFPFRPHTGILQGGGDPPDLSRLADICAETADPFRQRERQVARLQHCFPGASRRCVTEQTAFITESPACEQAFRQLFPQDSYNCYYRTLTVLLAVYRTCTT